MNSWIRAADEFPPIGRLVVAARVGEQPFVAFVPIQPANTRGGLRWVRVSCGGLRSSDSDAGKVLETDRWLPVPETDGFVPD